MVEAICVNGALKSERCYFPMGKKERLIICILAYVGGSFYLSGIPSCYKLIQRFRRKQFLAIFTIVANLFCFFHSEMRFGLKNEDTRLS